MKIYYLIGSKGTKYAIAQGIDQAIKLYRTAFGVEPMEVKLVADSPLQ